MSIRSLAPRAVHAPVAAPAPAPAALPVGAAGAGLAAVALAAVLATPAGAAFPAVAGAAYGLVAAGVLIGCRRAHPHGRFGAGNGLTLARAALACLALALAAAPEGLGGHPAARWGPLALAAAALVSDLGDGWLARRQGLASAFGARFDREVDALLILALSAVAVALQAAPAWALGIGLLHYLYLASGLLLPACRQPLPYSLTRRLVCGLQVAALGTLLAPPLAGAPSAAIAGVALAALAASFARDLIWCLRTGARDPIRCTRAGARDPV